jgi:hypothetical protein
VGPTKAMANSTANPPDHNSGRPLRRQSQWQRRTAAHLPPENGGRINRERRALQRLRQIQRPSEEWRPTLRQKTADAKTAKGGPYKGYGKFKGKAKNGGPTSATKRRTQKPRKVGPAKATANSKAKRRMAAHLPPESGGRKNRERRALQRQRQIQRQRRPTTRRVGPACDRQALQKQLLLWGGLWRRLGLGRRRRGLRLR